MQYYVVFSSLNKRGSGVVDLSKVIDDTKDFDELKEHLIKNCKCNPKTLVIENIIPLPIKPYPTKVIQVVLEQGESNPDETFVEFVQRVTDAANDLNTSNIQYIERSTAIIICDTATVSDLEYLEGHTADWQKDEEQSAEK